MHRTVWPPIALAFAVALSAAAQPPSGTWAIAKPVVDRWDAAYREAGRTIVACDQILAEIRKVLEQHSSDIWAYEAAALGYNRLDRNAEALDVMRTYLHRYPDESSLDERVLFFFGNWGARKDLESLPERWHSRPDYWRSLLNAYAREKAPPDLLEHACNEFLKLTRKQNDPGGNERYQVAELWLANGVDPRAAERVAREAVAISEVGDRPAATYEDERQRRIQNRLLIRNINRSALGWSLYQQGKYTEALAELQRAARIAEQDSFPTRAVYYRMGQTLEKLNRPQEAVTAYCKELAWGAFEEPTKAALRAVYPRLHGSADGLESAERIEVNELAAQRADRDSDLVSDVDEDLGRFDLLDESGSTSI
jgi:tetratricopeptide (TPR) repeat protein